jgi:hypothetical protein
VILWHIAAYSAYPLILGAQGALKLLGPSGAGNYAALHLRYGTLLGSPCTLPATGWKGRTVVDVRSNPGAGACVASR